MAGEESEFKVRDKRRFSEDGANRSPDAPAGSPDGSPASEEAARNAIPPEKEDLFAPLPEITFPAFIFSLGHSAFVHLGEEPDPVSGEIRVSLPLAKETIDILTILEGKTQGNLSPDEEHLMQNLLYALRIKYVEKATRK